MGPTVTINCVNNTIQLFWNHTGASSYRVYGATDWSGSYSLIGSTSDTFFTVSTVDTAAVRRFFEVRSVVE
jgi:fibronectin type 3 domain-containing protein